MPEKSRSLRINAAAADAAHGFEIGGRDDVLVVPVPTAIESTQ
jgi:hypothetical protein